MESLPLFAQARGRREGEHAAAAAGHRLLLERRRAHSLVGEGQPAPAMELGPGLLPMMPHREDMVFIQGLYNQTAAASTSPHLGRMNVLSGATVSLDPSEIRVGTSMDQVLAAQIGNRTAVPSLVLGIEPNELRLEDGLSMIYGSSRVVGLADQARDQGDLSLAHVRSPGRRRHRARRSIAASSTRCGRTRRACRPKISRSDNAQAERVLRVDPRHREAHRARVEGRAHRGLAADAGATRHAASGERAAAERARSHEADARPDRARVPDGQDAHRHADAQQRPVADELQVPRRRAGRAAPRPHAQREGRRQGSDVPEDQPVPHRAVRLPHEADEGDPRRRRHAARQLDPDVRRRASSTATPTAPTSCRSCSPARAAGRSSPAASSTTSTRATTTARRAACTCR